MAALCSIACAARVSLVQFRQTQTPSSPCYTNHQAVQDPWLVCHWPRRAHRFAQRRAHDRVRVCARRRVHRWHRVQARPRVPHGGRRCREQLHHRPCALAWGFFLFVLFVCLFVCFWCVFGCVCVCVCVHVHVCVCVFVCVVRLRGVWVCEGIG